MPRRTTQPALDGLGMRLRARRKAFALTQETLAERIGLKPESLSRIETGAVIPDLDTLARLAAAFGTDLSGLLADPNSKPTDPPGLPGWSSLSDGDRRLIRSLVDRLRKRPTQDE
jgi:transcriptional regulator with XRE-family HTH domain